MQISKEFPLTHSLTFLQYTDEFITELLANKTEIDE